MNVASTTSEKISTTITPEMVVTFAQNKGLNLTPLMAQDFIETYKDHFRGKTLKGHEVTILLKEHFGIQIPRQYSHKVREMD